MQGHSLLNKEQFSIALSRIRALQDDMFVLSTLAAIKAQTEVHNMAQNAIWRIIKTHKIT